MRIILSCLMYRSFACIATRLSIAAALLLSTHAQSASFDLITSAPVGSWQLRESVDTNHKGKQSVTKMKTSMVGKEQRNGQTYYWIEVYVETFKIKKNGKRKATGKPSIIKSLIPERDLKGDPANAINNLRAFGVETIVQSGNQTPMKMTKSGGLISGAMKAANIEVKHDYQNFGNETVTVAAGTFSTQKLGGTGEVTTKIVFKKINVKSDSTAWTSNKVPFGLVKAQGTTITNGKTSTHQTELLEFGRTGAKSAIVKEPQEMPSIKGVFGN